MGVLSDYPAEAKLRALGVADRFSPILCASDPEVGAFKPNPAGFLRACTLWGLTPAEVVFVGDRPDVDAAGARSAGMRCVIVGRKGSGDERGFMRLPSLAGLARIFEGIG
jgi:putative hydrolase of the HAD superfamily